MRSVLALPLILVLLQHHAVAASVVPPDLSSINENKAQKQLRMEAMDPIIHQDQLLSLFNRVTYVASHLGETLSKAWNNPDAMHDIPTTDNPKHSPETTQHPQDPTSSPSAPDRPLSHQPHVDRHDPNSHSRSPSGQESGTDTDADNEPSIIRDIADPARARRRGVTAGPVLSDTGRFSGSSHQLQSGDRTEFRTGSISSQSVRNQVLHPGPGPGPGPGDATHPEQQGDQENGHIRAPFHQRQTAGDQSRIDDHPTDDETGSGGQSRPVPYRTEQHSDADPLDYPNSLPSPAGGNRNMEATRSRRRFFKRRAAHPRVDNSQDSKLATPDGYPPNLSLPQQYLSGGLSQDIGEEGGPPKTLHDSAGDLPRQSAVEVESETGNPGGEPHNVPPPNEDAEIPSGGPLSTAGAYEPSEKAPGGGDPLANRDSDVVDAGLPGAGQPDEQAAAEEGARRERRYFAGPDDLQGHESDGGGPNSVGGGMAPAGPRDRSAMAAAAAAAAGPPVANHLGGTDPNNDLSLGGRGSDGMRSEQPFSLAGAHRGEGAAAPPRSMIHW